MNEQVTISVSQIITGVIGASILAVIGYFVRAVNRSCDKGVIAGLVMTTIGVTTFVMVESQEYVRPPVYPTAATELKDTSAASVATYQELLKIQNTQYEKQLESHRSAKSNALIPFWVGAPSLCLGLVGIILTCWRWAAWVNEWLPKEEGTRAKHYSDGYRL